MKLLFFASAVFSAMLTFVNCDKYEDGRPDKAIRNDFKAMYPNARDVEWDREGAYWTVSFETGARPDDVDHEAWYDASGHWVMTKTEVALSNVPQKVKDYLAADPTYGNASFEDFDAEFIEKPSGNFYRFDLILDGREVEVDVTEGGEVTPAKYGF